MKFNEYVREQIVNWMRLKNGRAYTNGFVVGVSGGVDSALVATLACMTNEPVYLIQMPIHRNISVITRRAEKLISNLTERYDNVKNYSHDLSSAFDAICKGLPCETISDLTGANIRSRLRMISLYAFANQHNCLVLGTGNLVEDFGVGFFTKYGDGGVDISPIGNLLKSEVRELASYVGVPTEIVDAIPTDELWSDGRSDEDAIGATYDELEWAMKFKSYHEGELGYILSERESEVLRIYEVRHDKNEHKMNMPPVCIVDKN